MRFPFQERQFSFCKSIHFFSGFRAISITQPKGQIPLKLNFASPGKVSVRALFWVPGCQIAYDFACAISGIAALGLGRQPIFVGRRPTKKDMLTCYFLLILFFIVIFVSGIKSDWPLDFLIVVFSPRKHPFLLVISPQRRRARRNGCFRRLCRVGNYIQVLTGKACAIRLLKTDWMLNSVIEFNVEVV